MSRRSETLDPRVQADLDALDAAVAGAPEADPAWAALVADVRREEPVLRPGLRADLARDVAAGFPRGGRRAAGAAAGAPGRARGWLRRGLLPALAVSACVAVGGVVVTSARDGDNEAAVGTAGSSSSDGSGGAAESATSGSGGAPSSSAQDSAVSSAPLPPTGDPSSAGPLGGVRRVERSTSLSLATAPGDLQEAADGVVREAKAAGGIVASSQVVAAGDGGSASFVLRVPDDRASAAVARISALADVVSLSESTQDITGSYTSAQDRLADARDERAALLRALGRAGTGDEADRLERRLRRARSRVARAEGDLRSLRRRTTSSRIDVSIEARDGAGGVGTWTPGDAARDALRVLEVGAGVALVAGAVLLPFVLLALLAAGARRARRRRREAALGAA
jgi:hypothetical protein